MSIPSLAEEAGAAALSTLPGMGPATLIQILSSSRPDSAWQAIRAGDPILGSGGLGRGARRRETDARTWAGAARRLDAIRWWEGHRRRGIRVTWLGRDDFPRALAGDPEPPGVLFWRGDLTCLDRPCVAIVGTRSATADGRRTAFEMGRDLAREGVCVVSGLAAGIDGAAHSGAVTACRAHPPAVGAGGDGSGGDGSGVGGAGSDGAGPSGAEPAGPVGVAASGVDVAYPARHADLWEEVCALGAVISENAPGRRPEGWRFPTRNRLIAAASRLVVVVESHAKGGSLITVEAALERGVDVRVVPGPVLSPASEGSNQLLCDGAGPVRHAGDVLDALGMFRSRLPVRAVPASSGGAGSPLRPGGPAVADARRRTVLDAVPRVACPLGRIVASTGLDIPDVLADLEALQAAGHVGGAGGRWWRRDSGRT